MVSKSNRQNKILTKQEAILASENSLKHQLRIIVNVSLVILNHCHEYKSHDQSKALKKNQTTQLMLN